MNDLLEKILWPDTPFPLLESLVLVGRRGSEAHGTYIPSDDPNSVDDRDIMGICIPPSDYYLGLHSWEGAETIKDVWDVALYEYKKFIRLLIKQNPNVIGMLWLDAEDYLYVSDAGNVLINNRNLFRSKTLAFKSFSGYAFSQLKKMSGSAYKGYMGAKRKSIVDRVGFDCKNAAHLIRLLHMGTEYLGTGIMQVKRTWDRDMLIDIKTGKWSLGQVQTYADKCFTDCKKAYINSELPEDINHEAINKIVINAIKTKLFD